MKRDKEMLTILLVTVLICLTCYLIVARISDEHRSVDFRPGCQQVITGRVSDQYTSRLDCPYDGAGSPDTGGDS